MQPVERTIGVQVSTDGIGVECNKDDVPQTLGHDLETGVRSAALNWLAKNEQSILHHNE